MPPPLLLTGMPLSLFERVMDQVAEEWKEQAYEALLHACGQPDLLYVARLLSDARHACIDASQLHSLVAAILSRGSPGSDGAALVADEKQAEALKEELQLVNDTREVLSHDTLHTFLTSSYLDGFLERLLLLLLRCQRPASRLHYLSLFQQLCVALPSKCCNYAATLLPFVLDYCLSAPLVDTFRFLLSLNLTAATSLSSPRASSPLDALLTPPGSAAAVLSSAPAASHKAAVIDSGGHAIAEIDEEDVPLTKRRRLAADEQKDAAVTDGMQIDSPPPRLAAQTNGSLETQPLSTSPALFPLLDPSPLPSFAVRGREQRGKADEYNQHRLHCLFHALLLPLCSTRPLTLRLSAHIHSRFNLFDVMLRVCLPSLDRKLNAARLASEEARSSSVTAVLLYQFNEWVQLVGRMHQQLLLKQGPSSTSDTNKRRSLMSFITLRLLRLAEPLLAQLPSNLSQSLQLHSLISLLWQQQSPPSTASSSAASPSFPRSAYLSSLLLLSLLPPSQADSTIQSSIFRAASSSSLSSAVRVAVLYHLALLLVNRRQLASIDLERLLVDAWQKTQQVSMGHEDEDEVQIAVLVVVGQLLCSTVVRPRSSQQLTPPTDFAAALYSISHAPLTPAIPSDPSQPSFQPDLHQLMPEDWKPSVAAGKSRGSGGISQSPPLDMSQEPGATQHPSSTSSTAASTAASMFHPYLELAGLTHFGCACCDDRNGTANPVPPVAVSALLRELRTSIIAALRSTPSTSIRRATATTVFFRLLRHLPESDLLYRPAASSSRGGGVRVSQMSQMSQMPSQVRRRWNTRDGDDEDEDECDAGTAPLNELGELVISLLVDSDELVRKAACSAVSLLVDPITDTTPPFGAGRYTFLLLTHRRTASRSNKRHGPAAGAVQRSGCTLVRSFTSSASVGHGFGCGRLPATSRCAAHRGRCRPHGRHHARYARCRGHAAAVQLP